MKFTWDPKKEKLNLKKHGVSFFDAADVIINNDYLLGFDSDNTTNLEDRFYAIGRSKNGILFIVFLENTDDTFRIISARKATKKEILIYEKNK